MSKITLKEQTDDAITKLQNALNNMFEYRDNEISREGSKHMISKKMHKTRSRIMYEFIFLN